MYNNILVPVVFGENHDAQAAFDVARALAAEGASFTVLHVMESIPSYVTVEIPHEVLAKTRLDVENSLVETANGLPGAKPVLVSGHAGRTIVDFAAENAVDCIVLASHRPGFGDMFLGSTASRVVRHAQCAVHVMR